MMVLEHEVEFALLLSKGERCQMSVVLRRI